MRALICSLTLCLGTGAQSISINAGGTAIPPFQADQYFTGGVAWVDPTMGVGILATLRYAPNFSYNIPLANGLYFIKFDLLEPNKTAATQRIFTIAANGVQSDPIDVFAVTHAINVPTSVTLLALVGNGHLRINFQAIAGNAMVSGIEVIPYAPSQTISGTTCAPPLSGSMDGAIVYAQAPDKSCFPLIAVADPAILNGFVGQFQYLFVKIPGGGTVSPTPVQPPQ